MHVEILGTEFPGETGEGARLLVTAVRKALNIRFQNTPAPNTLFVDLGPGFWATNSGKITGKFKAALQENHLKTYYKDDAGMQPGNLHHPSAALPKGGIGFTATPFAASRIE